ncbi:MAG: type III secretion system effector protein [Planctomycetales bacterium]
MKLPSNAQLWNSQRYPGIYIDTNGGATFALKARVALEKIRRYPVGRNLLGRISERIVAHKNKKRISGPDLYVPIKCSGKSGKNEQSSINPTAEISTEHPNGMCTACPGKGTSAEVLWWPSSDNVNHPNYIVLAHELIHALHALQGSVRKVYDWNDWKQPGGDQRKCGAAHEEARTVGLGLYRNESICENAIRKEHKIPTRKGYHQNERDEFAMLIPM